MTFTEQNAVENFIRDLLCGSHSAAQTGIAQAQAAYLTVGRSLKGAGWYYISALELPRRINDVFIEEFVRQALIRLNPSITEKPDRADEVLYKLRAIVLAVRSDGLIRANEEFTAWLRGERSMPFGLNGEHVTIRLLDFDDLDQNTVYRHDATTLSAPVLPSAAPTWLCSSTVFRW